MTRTRAFYCLVQYCPDPFRAEAANVGIVLLCPELRFLDVRLASGTNRPARFFSRQTVDRHALAAAKRSLRNAIVHARASVRGVDDLTAVLGRFGNALTFTALRPAVVDDPVLDLDRMFRELVGGAARGERQAARAISELDQVFAEFHDSPLVERNKRIVVPRIEVTIEVPYVYRNGRLNLIRSARFSDDERHARKQAELLIFEGQQFESAPIEPCRQIVVALAGGREAREDAAPRVAKMFGSFSQRFVRSEEVPAFAASIAGELRAHSCKAPQ